MGKMSVRAVDDAHIGMEILRILRPIGSGSVEVSRADPSSIVSDVLYTVEGAAVPDLGECTVTVHEERTEGSDWIRVRRDFYIERRK